MTVSVAERDEPRLPARDYAAAVLAWRLFDRKDDFDSGALQHDGYPAISVSAAFLRTKLEL